jgi:MYXO-CTERM domain-containing protein
VIIHKFAGLVCAFAFTAAAAPITFTFTGSGGTVGGPSPYGDTRTYTNGAYTVTATAFSLPGNETGNFVPGQLNWYNTLGLAVCNHTGEGANCDNPEHQVDNNGSYDFVLFTFNTVVDPVNIVINPYDTWDRDVTYWIGNTGTNLSTIGLAGLGGAGFGGRIDDDSTSSSAARTVLLGGGNGNALLFGARLSGNNDDDYIDRFKIESLTVSTAPEPATFGLAGLALVGLGLLRRRLSVN